jgi:hypothetical protein
MVKIFTSRLWSRYVKTLTDLNPKELRLMSEQVWRNTLKPLSRLLNRDTSPKDFCTAVTGDGLRWEVVGIICCMVSLLAGSLSGRLLNSEAPKSSYGTRPKMSVPWLLTCSDGDPIFCSHDEPPVDRASLTLKTHNAAEICLSFCDDFSVLNDLYLWLLYEDTIMYCALRTRGSR